MLAYKSRVKSISTRNIQGPATNRVSTSISSFGMKLKVDSLICVAACSMPITNPVMSAISSSGAAIIEVTSSVLCARSMTFSGVIGENSTPACR